LISAPLIQPGRGPERPARDRNPGDARPGRLARQYARYLRATLRAGAAATPLAGSLDADVARDWARSGLMWLTGPAGEKPARCHHALPGCASGALEAFRQVSGVDVAPGIDGAALLVERSVLGGFERGGATSVNGSCRLFACADGFIAVNLARDADRELLPAWLELEPAQCGDLAAALAGRRRDSVLARARLLGLPVAPVQSAPRRSPDWYRFECTGVRRHGADRPLVVDLSALWAGPLFTGLLQSAGAEVIKVECVHRPDGARGGPRAFYELLNAGKKSVQLDLRSERGRRELAALLQRADIVVESTRPRAMRQLGVDTHALLRTHPGKLWVSITGYGREPPDDMRVAFGDDAAAAAGLLHADGPGSSPAFCGDAPCDPLAGMHAALAATYLWQGGRGGLLALSLRDVGAAVAGFYRSVDPGEVVRHGRGWNLVHGGLSFRIEAPRIRGAAASC